VGKRSGGLKTSSYKLALRVTKEAYALASRLPDFEKYGLASQLRRAASGAMLNIAEGYGRYHYLARGSLNETLSGFIICNTVGYISEADLDRHRQLVSEALRTLNGYIRYVRNLKQGAETFGDKLIREDGPVYELSTEDDE
jgi:four helix bundle protein